MYASLEPSPHNGPLGRQGSGYAVNYGDALIANTEYEAIDAEILVHKSINPIRSTTNIGPHTP